LRSGVPGTIGLRIDDHVGEVKVVVPRLTVIVR
jgi:hypothetical protein